jgi:FkbM family methyltransferase
MENNTKFFEDNYNWKTINIEPGINIFKKLQMNRPRSININIALSDKEGISNFKNYKHPNLGFDWGKGSINQSYNHETELKNLCGENNYVEYEVITKSYKDIIDELKLEKLDLFVLDVEGNELNVIDGMIGCDILPDLFVIEIGHINLAPIINSLSKLNKQYKLDHISFVNAFFKKID